tara:strand:+ start:263 stop:595 length:333 start_codon:yes stop_codon:yes gene_type:complete
MSKIIINVTDRKNNQHKFEGQNNQTLMELIDDYKIAEPYGICCGEPHCGTCHVYVDENWIEKLDPKTDEEEFALDNASEIKNNSRLACQIYLSEELDGLSVIIGPHENQI